MDMEHFVRYSEAQVYGCVSVCENYIDEIDGRIMRADLFSGRIPTVSKRVMRNYGLWFPLNA